MATFIGLLLLDYFCGCNEGENEGKSNICFPSILTLGSVYANLKFQQAKNHVCYWKMIKILFHIIMNSKYIIQKLWDLFSHELLIWLFFISSFFKHLIKPMIYFWTVFGAWVAFILMEAPSKRVKLKGKKRQSWRFGFCKSKMILSCYMHDLVFTGYLKRIGCEPLSVTCKFHKLGLKSVLILLTLCNNSAYVMEARRKAVMEVIKCVSKGPVPKENIFKGDFSINLDDIRIYQEFSSKEANEFVNTRIEPVNCFMTEKVPVSTTVKNVLGTILANDNLVSCDEEDISFLPRATEFAVDNCATHHVCNDKKTFYW